MNLFRPNLADSAKFKASLIFSTTAPYLDHLQERIILFLSMLQRTFH
jgi:hypothetical protein